MTDSIRASSATTALWLLVGVGAVFLLRATRALLIPIALAVLISYALEPLVAWLERHRVPRAAGSGLVLLLILGVAAGGVYSLKDDAAALVATLPDAVQRARQTLVSQLGLSAEVVQEAVRGTGITGGERSGAAGGTPTETSGQMSGSLIHRVVSAIVAFAGHVVVVIFLIYFLLISAPHLRDRLVEIAGRDPERRRTASKIIDEINTQIQRYLLVLLVTAFIVGLATWVVLALIGVQHAAMWGLLSGVFNSVPYFGPVIVMGGVFAVGMVQGGVAQAVQASGAALLITSLEGWLITPPLMGKVERMSALAVFLGLLFWTWVWGGWGAILAVPMLVVIKSIAEHVEGLKPAGRLMAP